MKQQEEHLMHGLGSLTINKCEYIRLSMVTTWSVKFKVYFRGFLGRIGAINLTIAA